MTGVSNPINMPKYLDDQSAYLLAELFAKIIEEAGNTQNVVQAENGNLAAQSSSALSQILNKIAIENDQNQAILDSITTVNGELDTNVQTINDHTTAENDTLRGEIFSELQRTTAGSLYKLLYDALNSRIGTRATPTDVNSARDNVKSEITRTSAGSLYHLLKDWVDTYLRDGWSINGARTNINAVTNNARDSVKGAGNRDLTQVYNIVNALSGWATAADVNAARDNVKNHINARQTPVKSVQRGVANVSVGQSNPDYYDIPISAVNTGKAFVSAQIGAWRTEDRTQFCSFNLINSTTIRVQIHQTYTYSTTILLSWQVIEYV